MADGFGFNTSLLHSCREGDKETRATLTPIYQSSAFYQPSAEQHEKLFHNQAPGYSYTRLGNPTVAAFEERMTKLEGGAASVACASGMAALMNILRSGDGIISSASLYGGGIDLFKDLEAFGIHTVYVKNNDWEQIEESITEKTRVIFAETIGNPRLDVTDIRALSGLAHRHGLPLLMDNTVATSYLVKPLELGADIVVNSTSKYINGHSNAISGVITDGGSFSWDEERYPGMREYKKFGRFAYTAKLRNGLFRNTGACMAPQTAYYNLLGLETLGLRMKQECENALRLAEYLNTIDGIEVNYLGLPDSPWHTLAKEQLSRGFGAILTIRVGSKERAFSIMNNLKLPLIVSNIGDTKTLIVHPESTLNVHSTEKEKQDAGVYDDLIRISVGIEDMEDLVEDFRQAIFSEG